MQDPEQPIANQHDPARLYSEGIAAYQKRLYAEADKLFEQALMTNPSHAGTWHMRGVCCMKMARLDKAETFIRKALEIKKEAIFYANLGMTLGVTGNADEAIAAYRESLSINSDNAKVYFDLSNLLAGKGERTEAEALYRRAIKLAPDFADALANLGAMLFIRRSYAEAEKVLRRALALNPALFNSAQTLGTLLEITGRVAEAAPFFKSSKAWGLLAKNLLKRAAWDLFPEVEDAYISDLKRDCVNAASPLFLFNILNSTPALQQKTALNYANSRYGGALRRPPLVNSVACNGPLRIGYLSADYFDHATMSLLAGVLEAHDPGRVEIHLLSITARPVKDSSPYAERIAAIPAIFHDLSSISDIEAAERIAKIAPHLLIDLKGYTDGTRLNITAMRPAPVIVSWLGYPGTLGHPRLADYIIGDLVVTPPEHAADFSETLALMPHCYQPNDRSRRLDTAPSRKEEGLPESGFVFCCFNQFLKINPGTFDIWCRLLAATPDSVLWLLGDLEEGQANLRREAEKRGIAADRIVFTQRKPITEHLARLQLADLALDTFPYNSHTTASDALWAGVPLVTRIGETFASRVAASLLTTHGLPELIAPDDDAYFEIALSLINQPEKLQQIRQKLKAARLTSPLFDTARFARDLERLYEAIWQQHDVPRDQRAPIVFPP